MTDLYDVPRIKTADLYIIYRWVEIYYLDQLYLYILSVQYLELFANKMNTSLSGLVRQYGGHGWPVVHKCQRSLLFVEIPLHDQHRCQEKNTTIAPTIFLLIIVEYLISARLSLSHILTNSKHQQSGTQ